MFTVKLVYGKYREPIQSMVIKQAESVQYARGDDYHLITMFNGGSVCGEFQIFDNSDGIAYIENANGKTIQKFEAYVSELK